MIALFVAGSVLTASPLAPQMRDEETYSETWTAVFELSGETYVQVQFAVSNLGLGDDNAACRILIIEPEASWTANQYEALPNWGFRPPHRLDIGPCYVEGGETTHIHAEVGGGTVDATLAEQMVAISPPGHHIETDDGFFEQRVLIPHAATTVFYRRPGAKERRGHGWAAVDHFRVTALPSDLARRWIRVYALSAAGSLVLMARQPPEDGSAPTGWLWPPRADRPERLETFTLRAVAGGWQLDAHGGATHWSATLSRHLFRYAPLEQFGILGWVAGSLLGNPVSHTWRARLEGAAGGPVTAVVELTTTE